FIGHSSCFPRFFVRFRAFIGQSSCFPRFFVRFRAFIGQVSCFPRFFVRFRAFIGQTFPISRYSVRYPDSPLATPQNPPLSPSPLSTLTSPTISIYIYPVFNINWLVIVSRHALYNYIDHYVILKITKMEVLQMGILSVVPPLIAIFLAIVTRRVIISLFISIWVGGIIYTGGDPFSGLG